MLDHEGVSRWRQVGEALIEDIQSGALPAEKRLPRSEDLAARFGVNRHTVLRALSHLQAEGFIRMERGRGSYAVVNPLEYRIGPRRWFEQNLMESNRSPSRTVIAVIEMGATETIARHLNIAVGDDVVFVTLLGEADGFPVNFNYHYFPLRRLPGIADAFRAFGREPTTELSFSKILQSLGVNDWRRKTVRIRSRVPTPEEARRLKMAPSDHVLETEVTSVDGDDVPLVHANTCFCSSRVELLLDLPS